MKGYDKSKTKQIYKFTFMKKTKHQRKNFKEEH